MLTCACNPSNLIFISEMTFIHNYFLANHIILSLIQIYIVLSYFTLFCQSLLTCFEILDNTFCFVGLSFYKCFPCL